VRKRKRKRKVVYTVKKHFASMLVAVHRLRYPQLVRGHLLYKFLRGVQIKVMTKRTVLVSKYYAEKNIQETKPAVKFKSNNKNGKLLNIKLSFVYYIVSITHDYFPKRYRILFFDNYNQILSTRKKVYFKL
jgi:hypothetical protein